MKLKELQSNLEQVETFSKPKLQLEQYITTPHIASQIVYNVDQMFDDLEGKMVCDLGCGTGMLSIGSLFMNADYVLGIDIDRDALDICQENFNLFEFDSACYDLVQMDLKNIVGQSLKLENRFDTVIMNPPFGTKNQKLTDNSCDELNNLGIDVLFLKVASQLTTNSIYSIHKSVTRNYMQTVSKRWNLKMEVVSQLRYNIPKIDTRNRGLEKNASQKDVEVDFIRFTLNV